MTVQQMKNEILGVYDTASWRNKVNRMYDDQIIAIYHNFSERGILGKVLRRERPATVYEPAVEYPVFIDKEKPKQEIQQQLTIFDFLEGDKNVR